MKTETETASLLSPFLMLAANRDNARTGIASGLEELYEHGSECLRSDLVGLTFQSAVL